MKAAIPKTKSRDSVALRAFFKVAEKWQLTPAEQMRLLGDVASSTLYNYRSSPEGVTLGTDMLDRISYVLGIHQDLQSLFSKSESANTWVKKPNSAPPFNGRSALQLMLDERLIGLHTVRLYLAGQKGR